MFLVFIIIFYYHCSWKFPIFHRVQNFFYTFRLLILNLVNLKMWHETVKWAGHVWPLMLYLPKLTHVQVNGRVVYRKKVSVISVRYLLSECFVITCAVNNKFQTEKNCIGPPTINLHKYSWTSANGHLFLFQPTVHTFTLV